MCQSHALVFHGVKSIFILGLYSLSGKASYRKFSWGLEAERLDVITIVSLCNLTGISATVRRLTAQWIEAIDFNLSCTEIGIFRQNVVSTITADALAPYVVVLSADMVLCFARKGIVPL